MPLANYAYFAGALLTAFWIFHLFRRNLLPRKPTAHSSAPRFPRLEENFRQEVLAPDSTFAGEFGIHIPQDSILRRHFLTHVRHMLETVASPYPTDSVLRRHADQWLEAEFSDCLKDPARCNQLLADYHAVRAETGSDNQSMPDPEPIEATAGDSCEVHESLDSPAWIPEDSVLRRHFLSHCRYMLEEVMAPAPTDSVLARHYEQLIESDFAACLQNEAQMTELLEGYAAHRRNGSREFALGSR